MWEDDDEFEFILKFDDCQICKYKYQPDLYCESDCDAGESFEEEDPDDLEDMIIR